MKILHSWLREFVDVGSDVEATGETGDHFFDIVEDVVNLQGVAFAEDHRATGGG